MGQRRKLSSAEKEELFRKGASFFNAEEFYEAHEAWEEIWLQEEGRPRLFYQGLIQIAAGFHHMKRGKLKSALTCLLKGMEKLEGKDILYLLDAGRMWVGYLTRLIAMEAVDEKLTFPKINV